MMTVGQIIISNSLIEKLGIPREKQVKVRVGMKTVNSQLIIRSARIQSYLLSPSLAHALHLKRAKRLQIRYDENHALIHIGPTIGILTSFLPNHEEYDPKSKQAELIYLSKISRNMPAQVYMFTPGSINWRDRTVRGSVYRQTGDQQGLWISSIYPLPDVVYDRIGSRSGEARASTQYTKRKLKSLANLKYFNPSFLNKWTVHKLLIQNEALLPYLPETQRLNAANLEEMAARYPTLYLKPANGSLGQGIIKLNTGQGKNLHYIIHRNGRHSGKANSLSEFMRKTQTARKGRTYIVQQGLKLATVRNSPFDIRIIYQKNRNGEWQISKKFVRVAAPGSSVANLSRGGRAETSKKIFKILFASHPGMIDLKNEEIKELCKMIAETLEAVSGDTYGELGLDLGIDVDNRLWLIEVNSKPQKTTETDLSQAIVRNTFKRPLEYAAYLSGFIPSEVNEQPLGKNMEYETNEEIQ